MLTPVAMVLPVLMLVVPVTVVAPVMVMVLALLPMATVPDPPVVLIRVLEFCVVSLTLMLVVPKMVLVEVAPASPILFVPP